MIVTAPDGQQVYLQRSAREKTGKNEVRKGWRANIHRGGRAQVHETMWDEAHKNNPSVLPVQDMYGQTSAHGRQVITVGYEVADED